MMIHADLANASFIRYRLKLREACVSRVALRVIRLHHSHEARRTLRYTSPPPWSSLKQLGLRIYAKGSRKQTYGTCASVNKTHYGPNVTRSGVRDYGCTWVGMNLRKACSSNAETYETNQAQGD